MGNLTKTDKAMVNSILKGFILHQRGINYQFRKEQRINRYQVEILTFANTTLCFNPYNVQRYYIQMNLQQVRISIKKLVLLGALEQITSGVKGKPSVYMITKEGRNYLQNYVDRWVSALNLN